MVEVFTAKNTNNQLTDFKKREKYKSYVSLYNSYGIMNVKDVNESIKEIERNRQHLASFNQNFNVVKTKLSSIDCACICLRNKLESDKSFLLNDFEKTKISMDIELLHKSMELKLDDCIETFNTWFEYRRALSKSIKRSLHLYKTVEKNISSMLQDYTVVNSKTAEKIQRMKSKLHLDSLLKLMVNYGEILAIKYSLKNGNAKPAEIYIKSFIKTIFSENSDYVETARKTFRDNGSIPNIISDFNCISMKGYKEFSSIVIEELQNIEVDNETTMKVIDNIYTRFNRLLTQYRMWLFEKLKQIRQMGENNARKNMLSFNTNTLLKKYLSDGIVENIDSIYDFDSLSNFQNNQSKLFDEQKVPDICSIDTIQKLFQAADEEVL